MNDEDTRVFWRNRIFIVYIFLLGFVNVGSVTACDIASAGTTMYFDDSGNGIQVWSELIDNKYYVIKSSLYDMDRGWLEPEIISPDNISCENPVLAVSQDWNCLIAWVYVDPELGYNRLCVMTKLAGMPWGKYQEISVPEERVISKSYKLVVDNSNRILLLWDSLIDAEEPIVFRQIGRSCQSSFGGSWSEPQTIRQY